jgi:MFS family permease
VPLGDLFERRRLIVVMSLLSAGGLVISACAPSLTWLLVGTAITGLFSVVAQVLVPFAATLAAPEHRGRVVGTLMSGLLLGILLARTVAGLLSSLGDWRLVYAIAAGTLVLTALALQRGLPRFHHSAGLGYFALLRSIGVLFVQEPVLRQRTLLGACSFAMFAIFWTPLAFLLAQPPYAYSDATIGLFGWSVPPARWPRAWPGACPTAADRRATAIALVLLLLSWLPLGLSAHSLLALLVGVVVLDLAAQLLRQQPEPDLRTATGGAQPPQCRLHDRLLHRRFAGFAAVGAGLPALRLDRRLRGRCCGGRAGPAAVAARRAARARLR